MNLSDKWIIEKLEVGMLMVNSYIVGWEPTGEAIVIDPGDEAERIYQRASQMNLEIKQIINTHGHGDHIGGNRELIELTKAPLYIGEKDAGMLTSAQENLSAPLGIPVTSPPADHFLKEGDVVTVGEGQLKVFEAPGHSRGSIILVGDGFAIVGDVLFAQSIGRTDFPGGSFNLLIRMIREKIFPLGDDCVILPGHGPETLIGAEKRHNPFLQPGFQNGYLI